MNFNTAPFHFLFLPIFLITYFVSRSRWRPVLGVFASLVFYAWGDAHNLFLLFALLLINYFLGRYLVASERPKRWVLPLSLLINVGVLAFFKLFIAYRPRGGARVRSLAPVLHIKFEI